MPRVSIGLPVYNGEKYLSEAIESILAQTFRDFELIISDNCSTDQTERICRAYEKRDKRVRYFRSEINQGAAWNFNRCFELASGEYFRWSAHDDACAPEYLQRCVDVIERDPTAVLCQARTRVIDPEGKVLREEDYQMELRSERPSQRLSDLISETKPCYAIFGLIRAGVLRRTSLMGGYISADRVLLAELSLLGQFREVPECLFFAREHPLSSLRAHLTFKSIATWFDASRRGALVLPRLRLFLEYLKAITRAKVDVFEKCRCCRVMSVWFWRNWRVMGGELKIELKSLGHLSK